MGWRGSRGRGTVVLLAVLAGAAGCHGERAGSPHSDTRGGIARPVSVEDAARGRFAPAAPPSAGALNYLSAYVGKPAAVSGLFSTRPVDARLRALLGPNYARFIAALPDAPLVDDDGVYSLSGHTADGIAAIVLDPRADSIYAVEQDGTGRREYLERSLKPPLPAGVRALLASVPLR